MVANGGAYALMHDETRGTLRLAGPGEPRPFRVLDELASYDDALDAMNDVRALCHDGVSLAEVVRLTYGLRDGR